MHSEKTIIAAASNAIGVPLTTPQRLPGSERNIVLRCTTPDGTVIVKAHADHEFYANEAAGLAFTHRGPRLLATDPRHHLSVIADLGDHPSLADLLLATDPAAADHALTAWADTYSRLAVETHGREPEYDVIRGTQHRSFDGIEPDELAAALRHYGITPHSTLADDLATLARLDETHRVFSPGDICPDNNIISDTGFHIIDFEGAGYHSLFLDAAYTTMPFSSCWCVFRLPTDIATRIETGFRAAITTVCPDMADDRTWQRGIVHATARFTMEATTWLGPKSATGDRTMNPERDGVPTARQLLRHRWTHLATTIGGELPAIARLTDQLIAATDRWDVEPLPYYPAFTPTPPTTVSS